MHYTSTPLLSPLRYFCTPALPTEHEISICDLDAIYPLRSRAPHTLMVDSSKHRPLYQALWRTKLSVFNDVLLGSSLI
jgi:hypothetical protein